MVWVVFNFDIDVCFALGVLLCFGFEFLDACFVSLDVLFSCGFWVFGSCLGVWYFDVLSLVIVLLFVIWLFVLLCRLHKRCVYLMFG